MTGSLFSIPPPQPHFNKLMRRKWLTSSEALDGIVGTLGAQALALRRMQDEPYQVCPLGSGRMSPKKGVGKMGVQRGLPKGLGNLGGCTGPAGASGRCNAEDELGRPKSDSGAHGSHQGAVGEVENWDAGVPKGSWPDVTRPLSPGAGGRAAPARVGGVRAAAAPRASAMSFSSDPQSHGRAAP